MKKISLLLGTVFVACCLLTSCFDDDSTSGFDENGNLRVGELTVSGLEETYTKTAYIQEHLQINPVVEGYSDNELSYHWILINDQTGKTNAKGDTIQPIDLGTEKNLDYEVNLAPGDYQVRLYTTVNKTGLVNIAYASLVVQTSFSQGFYVLKETADGNTEMDQLTASDEIASNLITKLTGSPMRGKPQSLYPNYGISYIDPSTDEMGTTAALTLTTESGDFAILRNTDLATIFNRETILFEEMDANEKVYATFQTSMSNVMVTSAGFYAISSGGAGKYGMPTDESGTSPYLYVDFANYGSGAMWDAKTKSLNAFDYGMNNYPLTYADMTGEDVTQNLSGYECLHSGVNYVGSTTVGVFILRNTANGERFLYLTKGSFRNQVLTTRVKLTGHMANASRYSTNGRTASYIYCVDGGKIYACNLSSGDFAEVELQPQGISSGETINFVSNQFWYPANGRFDYLIVGTQSGNNYKLYFYQTTGGAPVGAPVKTMEGEGKVSKIRYMSPSFNSNYSLFYGYCYSIFD